MKKVLFIIVLIIASIAIGCAQKETTIHVVYNDSVFKQQIFSRIDAIKDSIDKHWIPIKDTVVIHDTIISSPIVIHDTVVVYRTIIVHDTIWIQIPDTITIPKDTTIIPKDTAAIPKDTIVGMNNYYVANYGNDNNDGKTPATAWQTLAKINTSSFMSGDVIRLNKEDVFEGNLSLTNRNNLVITSYGQGENPVITGKQTLTNWQLYRNNIYYTIISPSQSQARFLYVNGFIRDKARWPNTGWNIIDAVSGNNRIIDIGLNKPRGYYNGATLISHSYYLWGMIRSNIVQSGDTMRVITPGYGVGAGNGYILVDDTTCIDQDYEWCFDENTHRVYIQLPTNPCNYSISVDNNGVLLGLNNCSNVKVDDVTFTSGSRGINAINSSNIEITNCVFKDFYIPIWLQNLRKCLVDNNHISNATCMGMNLARVYQSHITNNYIEHVFDNYTSFDEMSSGDGGQGIHVWYTFDDVSGVNVGSDSVVLSRNELYKIGYSGIRVSLSNKTYLTENKVTHYNYLKKDGGGLYTWRCDTIRTPGYDSTYIARNYVEYNEDSTQNNSGQSIKNQNDKSNFGIYCDDYSQNVRIERNFLKGARSGIFLHNDYNMYVYNNMFWPEKISKAVIRLSDKGGSGGFNQNKIYIRNNILPCFYDDTTVAWILQDDQGVAPTVTMQTSGNYFMGLNTQYRGYGTNTFLYEGTDGTSNSYTVAQWNASRWSNRTDKDTPFKFESTGLPVVDSMVVGYFNWSNTNYTLNIKKQFGASYYYYDVDGLERTDESILMVPYKGIILLRSINKQ